MNTVESSAHMIQEFLCSEKIVYDSSTAVEVVGLIIAESKE